MLDFLRTVNPRLIHISGKQYYVPIIVPKYKLEIY